MSKAPKKGAAAPEKAGGKSHTVRPRVARMWWCVLAGCLIFMSFPFMSVPASNIWPLAFVALVPFFFVLENATPKGGFWLGWLVGFVTNMGGFWWVSHVLENFGQMSPLVAWFLTALNAACQGLQLAIFGWLFCRLRPPGGMRHSILRVAMIFTAVEFVFPMIFPWFYGNSQYRFLPMIQMADLTGVMGVTFVMVLFNGAVYETVRHRWLKKPLERSRLYIGYGATVVALIYGLIRLAQVTGDMEQADKLRFGIIEADIGILNDELAAHPDLGAVTLMQSHLLRHQRMSTQLADKNIDLIVWPESSYLPMGRMHLKRDPDFAIGVTSGGKLVVWRDLHPNPFGWALKETVSDQSLRAVASAREDNFAAVGDKGVVLHGKNAKTSKVKTSSRRNLLAVALARVTRQGSHRDGAPVALWAAGEGGTLLKPQFKGVGSGRRFLASDNRRLDRVSPHGVQPWTDATLRAIAMSDALTGWVVGDRGTLVKIQHALPRLVGTGLTEDFYGLWGGTLDLPVPRIVGSSGGVWKIADNGALTREKTPTSATLRAIAGHGDTVFAAGDGGIVIKLQADRTWAAVGERVGEDLVGLTVDPIGVVLVSGAKGGLWRWAAEGWQRLDSSGLGVINGLAPLGYVSATPMPRGTRYIRQSTREIPNEDAFHRNNKLEYGVAQEFDSNAVQRGFTTPILYGGITWEPQQGGDGKPDERKYNTAILLDDIGRVVDTYDKNYLLMFGEYIPLGDRFPVLYEWFPSGRFEAGTDVKVFSFKGHKIGVMICYEDILPQFTRRLADKDPNVIINVTNDAWFGKNSEPYLHLALASFRSIENRVSLIRSTNTGVSAVIAPTGEIVQQTSLEGPETMIADIPMMSGGTVYGRLGDAFSYFMLIWLALISVRQFLAGREPKSANRKGAA